METNNGNEDWERGIWRITRHEGVHGIWICCHCEWENWLVTQPGKHPFGKLECSCGHKPCLSCTFSGILQKTQDRRTEVLVPKGMHFGHVCPSCGLTWAAQPVKSPWQWLWRSGNKQLGLITFKLPGGKCTCGNQALALDDWFRFKVGTANDYMYGDPDATWQRHQANKLLRRDRDPRYGPPRVDRRHDQEAAPSPSSPPPGELQIPVQAAPLPAYPRHELHDRERPPPEEFQLFVRERPPVPPSHSPVVRAPGTGDSYGGPRAASTIRYSGLVRRLAIRRPATAVEEDRRRRTVRFRPWEDRGLVENIDVYCDSGG